MNTEKDKKALKAFWCMLDTAKNKKRDVSIGSSCIYIWANKKEGRGILADIKIETQEKKVILKKYFFNLFHKYGYESENFVYGKVINPSDEITHHFSFDGEEALEIAKIISEKYNNYQEEEKRKEEKSLNELLC